MANSSFRHKNLKKGNNEPVSGNLCGKIYQTCGNTTNLATHYFTKNGNKNYR